MMKIAHWAELVGTALVAWVAVNGCASKSDYDSETHLVVPDASEPPVTCGPGTILMGSVCLPAPGSGGASSSGGRPGSGGALLDGSAGSSGATSTGGSPGSGGVSTSPDGGYIGDAQGPQYDTGLSDDKTAPEFAGCKAVSDVSFESFTVAWDAATDDRTPANRITYEIWVRPQGSPGSPGSSPPTATVVGATNVKVEGLMPGTDYEIWCGARDSSRNGDVGQQLLTTTTLTDGTPPVFAGLATVEGISRHAARLSWNPASDNASTGSEIVYAVYATDAAGAEDFTTPVLLTDPGQTSVDVGGLGGSPQFFVVRARDRAGNEDANTLERNVALTLPTSFEIDVQPIFTANCAITICHWPGADGTNPPIEGLNLAEGAAYTNIVNVVARQGIMISPPEPNLKRIDATSSNPMDSYLWRKIQVPELTNKFGGVQPGPQSGRSLTANEIQIITDWIIEGTLNN